MNKRQKKKKLQRYNKKLIEEYPFLLPRNVWTGEVMKGYNYTYTEWDDLPDGWRKAFGDILLEELRESLIKHNFLNKFRFSQIKEKYGSARFYHFGAPEETCNILRKYEFLSEYICVKCGKPNVPVIDNHGWYEPLCEACYNLQEKCVKAKFEKNKIRWYHIVPYHDLIDGEIDIPREYKNERYANGVTQTIIYDISETVDKILEKYNKRFKSKKS